MAFLDVNKSDLRELGRVEYLTEEMVTDILQWKSQCGMVSRTQLRKKLEELCGVDFAIRLLTEHQLVVGSEDEGMNEHLQSELTFLPGVVEFKQSPVKGGSPGSLHGSSGHSTPSKVPLSDDAFVNTAIAEETISREESLDGSAIGGVSGMYHPSSLHQSLPAVRKEKVITTFDICCGIDNSLSRIRTKCNDLIHNSQRNNTELKEIKASEKQTSAALGGIKQDIKTLTTNLESSLVSFDDRTRALVEHWQAEKATLEARVSTLSDIVGDVRRGSTVEAVSAQLGPLLQLELGQFQSHMLGGMEEAITRTLQSTISTLVQQTVEEKVKPYINEALRSFIQVQEPVNQALTGISQRVGELDGAFELKFQALINNLQTQMNEVAEIKRKVSGLENRESTVSRDTSGEYKKICDQLVAQNMGINKVIDMTGQLSSNVSVPSVLTYEGPGNEEILLQGGYNQVTRQTNGYSNIGGYRPLGERTQGMPDVGNFAMRLSPRNNERGTTDKVEQHRDVVSSEGAMQQEKKWPYTDAPAPKLGECDGSGCEEFLLQLEKLAKFYDWTDATKATRLFLGLTGNAKTFFLSLPHEKRFDYNWTKQRLLQRFEPRNPQPAVTTKLAKATVQQKWVDLLLLMLLKDIGHQEREEMVRLIGRQSKVHQV